MVNISRPLLPCVPEIVTLKLKSIEPIIFVASLTKQLKTQKFMAQARDDRSGSVTGVPLSSTGVRSTVYEGHNPLHT